MTLPNGTILRNTYRIVRTIGAGGFGITYEVMHEGLQARMAVKEFFVSDFCNRDDSTGCVTVATRGKEAFIDKLKNKFLSEARALAKLQHPNIVRVTDVFGENDTVYFVMDYIEGRSLADLVAGHSKLPEQIAVKYMLQVCDALSYVHANRRMHLDVKPDNIMVNAADQAVLIDFGASKQYDQESGENQSTVIGYTPGYAPAEQMGNDISQFTPATDVYALGATLYRLLTGNTPPNATLLLNKPLPPLSDKISSGVRKAIAQAMRPTMLDRPQSVAEFAAMLSPDEKIIVTEPDYPHPKLPESESTIPIEKSKPIIKPNKGRVYLIAALAAAALIICSVILIGGKKGDSYPPQPAPQPVPQFSKPRQNETFTVNGVSFTMVPVDGGTFMMGSNDGNSDEKPLHSVTLSDYKIGQTEVTQALWKAVMGSNPSYFKGDDLPVERVSWKDCQKFITKLNSLTGQRFRLPTEAEWEYAARGGSKSQGYIYSGSNNINEVAWYGDNSGEKAHAVKAKAPNELGLYDMSGNVYEWCQDLYGGYSSGSQTNPTGPSSGSDRVFRGGGCYSGAILCRVAFRRNFPPSKSDKALGLRLAL